MITYIPDNPIDSSKLYFDWSVDRLGVEQVPSHIWPKIKPKLKRNVTRLRHYVKHSDSKKVSDITLLATT